MKLNELHLKHFGKFTDRKIELRDGFNVLYGPNGSGKSTIFSFIKGMLFGMERGRGRASVNDIFSLYEPWENSNYYAGMLKFTSGGRRFVLERNFDKYSKGAKLICEDDGEELSLEHGDLDILLNGIDRDGFENTIAIGQRKVETSQSLAAELRNYAVNYYAAGDSEIDLNGALSVLRGEKKEIEKQIRAAAAVKQEKRSRVEQEMSFVWRDIHEMTEELQRIREKIALSKAKEEQLSPEEDSIAPRRWRIHPFEILSILAAVILAVTILKQPWSYLVPIVIILAGAIYVWNRLKDGRRKISTPSENELAEFSRRGEEPIQKLKWEYRLVEESLKEKQIQYNNLSEGLEEMDELGEEFKEQDKRICAIDMAADKLLSLSEAIHQEIGTRLNDRASQILSSITDGAYDKIIIEEDLTMFLMSGHRRIAIRQVSRGTIEQVYFALRMAVSEILYEEEYPVILDDTFAYYDDNRMEKTMKWLSENRKQILLFTCHKREMEALNSARIQYWCCGP